MIRPAPKDREHARLVEGQRFRVSPTQLRGMKTCETSEPTRCELWLGLLDFLLCVGSKIKKCACACQLDVLNRTLALTIKGFQQRRKRGIKTCSFPERRAPPTIMCDYASCLGSPDLCSYERIRPQSKRLRNFYAEMHSILPTRAQKAGSGPGGG